MDFRFTEPQRELRGEIREFAARELTPTVLDDLARSGESHSPGIWRAIADRGYLALGWPKEFGGLGRGQIEMSIFKEEMGYAGAPMWAYTTTIDYVSRSIMTFGSEEQKRFFLPRISRGELVCCFSLTEPNAGSDAAAITTLAIRDGDRFRIKGTKVFTSNAHVADYALVVTRTNRDGAKHEGMTLFMVDLKNTPGITIKRIPTLAGHADTCFVFYDDVIVPASAALGEIDSGWKHLTQTLDLQRSSQDLGGMRRTVDDLAGHLRMLRASGGAENKLAVAEDALAGVAAKVEMARMLFYNVAWLQTLGRRCTVEASYVKLYVTTLFQELIETALDIAGPEAHLEWECDSGNPLVPFRGRLTRLYRSTPILTVGGGSREMQLTIIARRSLGLPVS